ncbi:MAG: hypothetical protein ABIT01_02740, partial [Thermoanaerobaculia bacterium]
MTASSGIVAATLAALIGLPVTPLPSDHPSNLPDAVFQRFYEKEGVVIRTATVDGSTIVRSTTTLPGAPEKAARMLADVGSWSAWVKRLRSSNRLAGEPPAFWLRFDAPWPFSDRDYAVVPALTEDGDGNLILWWETGAARLPPPEAHSIRVTEV